MMTLILISAALIAAASLTGRHLRRQAWRMRAEQLRQSALLIDKIRRRSGGICA